MSEHAEICGLMASMIEEQARTNEALTRLMEAIAGVRAKVTAAAREKETVATQANAPANIPATAVEAPAPAVSPAASPTAEKATTITAPAILDYKKDVGPTFAKLLGAKGAPAVVEILSRFNVKKGVELTADQLPAALAAAITALGE